jgi:hypothetical protein
MNVDHLARHYDKLTPRERFPLIVAATARDDEIEATRLARSAPTRDYRVPDYWLFSRGLLDLAQFYLLQQVELAATFWRSFALVAVAPAPADRPERSAARQEVLEQLRFTAYRCLVLAEAWQIFCVEWHLAPEALPRLLPGYDGLEGLLEASRRIAFTAEEALAYLRETVELNLAPTSGASRRNVTYRMETAGDLARSLRDYLQSAQ